MWIKSIELSHLALGPPAKIAVSGLAKIGVGECLETTRAAEAGSHLIGQTFVLHEPILAGRANGLLVQAHGIGVSPIDPGYLGPDECRPGGKILEAMNSPGVELLQVIRQPPAMIFAVLRRGRFINCRMAKRIVEVVLNDLQKRQGARDERLRPRGRLQCVEIFAREKTCLQLADVVPTFRQRERRLAGQSMLKITFTEHSVVKRAKTGSQSPQAPDETKLTKNPAFDRSEADFADKSEPMFSLLL